MPPCRLFLVRSCMTRCETPVKESSRFFTVVGAFGSSAGWCGRRRVAPLTQRASQKAPSPGGYLRAVPTSATYFFSPPRAPSQRFPGVLYESLACTRSCRKSSRVGISLVPPPSASRRPVCPPLCLNGRVPYDVRRSTINPLAGSHTRSMLRGWSENVTSRMHSEVRGVSLCACV